MGNLRKTGKMTASQEVVTPFFPGFRRDRVNGVQAFLNSSETLDSGACPGPDPGFAGMT